jgi:hypothetical protein
MLQFRADGPCSPTLRLSESRYSLNAWYAASVSPSCGSFVDGVGKVSVGGTPRDIRADLRYVQKTRPWPTDERDLMGSKKKADTHKKSSAGKKELKKTQTVLRGQLTKTETKLEKAKAKAERWRKEAAAQRNSAARSGARAEKLQKKLDRASADLEPTVATGPLEAAASGRPAAEPTTIDGVTIPDETWTVVELRAEARARGLVGMSNKSKAQLLAALS